MHFPLLDIFWTMLWFFLWVAWIFLLFRWLPTSSAARTSAV